MNTEQAMVKEFHRQFRIHISEKPEIPSEEVAELREVLMTEELSELAEAMECEELQDIAKELADLLYVVYGTAVAYGIDMEPVFKEVHRSNMTKIGGYRRADGKWMKSPTYSKAQLKDILKEQSDK